MRVNLVISDTVPKKGSTTNKTVLMSLDAFRIIARRAQCYRPARQGLPIQTESLRILLNLMPSVIGAYTTSHPDVPLALRDNSRTRLAHILHGNHNTVPNATGRRFMAVVYRAAARGFLSTEYVGNLDDNNDDDDDAQQRPPRQGRKGGTPRRRDNRKRSRSAR